MENEATGSAYVERIEGVFRVVGTRVSLDSIVYAFWNRQTPESIAQSFPTLSLEQVYGAVAFYLAHTDDVDAYLQRRGGEFEAARQTARSSEPTFHQRLANARERAAVASSARPDT